MCCNIWISYKDKQLLYISGGGGGIVVFPWEGLLIWMQRMPVFPSDRSQVGLTAVSMLVIWLFTYSGKLDIIQTVPDPEGHQLLHAVTTPIYGPEKTSCDSQNPTWNGYQLTVRRRVSIQTVRNRLISKWNISKIVMFWVFLHLT